MKENAPEKSRANVLIILGHFQKWLTGTNYCKKRQRRKSYEKGGITQFGMQG